jgi:hypothetical protein
MGFESSTRRALAKCYRRFVWPFPRTVLLAGLVAFFYGSDWSVASELQTCGQYLVVYLALSSVMDLELRCAAPQPASGLSQPRTPLS